MAQHATLATPQQFSPGVESALEIWRAATRNAAGAQVRQGGCAVGLEAPPAFVVAAGPVGSSEVAGARW